MSKPSDLVQGTLDMLLLKILALEPLNGFAVSQRLKQVSGDVLQVSDGSLYPALHKLEQEGWITAEWKTSEYGRRAKYYSLTRLGRRQLEKEADNWHLYGDLYIPTDFYNQIKDLTGTSDQDLINKMIQVKTNYVNSQGALAGQRLNTDEHQAYAVSDPIAPQYVYQNCGKY
jgi:PadR family transcriptional regulator PadR